MSYVTPSDLPGGLQVRRPRAWLQTPFGMIEVTSASVSRKSTRNADTFTATFPVSASDLARWVDWDQSQDVSIIFATQPGGGDRQVMVTGKIDRPTVTFEDMSVSIRSRDKSGALTEKRRSKKFQNMTSSDIVGQIASDHGLSPSIVKTGDFAGKKLTHDVANLIQNRTDYEVVSLLAEREAYRWYVEGSTLYYEPKGQESGVYPIRFCPPGSGAPYAVGNCFRLTFDRNTAAARPHKVTVRSWHHHEKKLYQHSAEAGGTGDPVEYVHHHNGKTLDQVTALAKSRLKDRVRHEMTINAELPGDLGIDPRMKVSVTGTGTSVDQQYDIDTIGYAMGWDGGFTMTICAKSPKQGRTVE